MASVQVATAQQKLDLEFCALPDGKVAICQNNKVISTLNFTDSNSDGEGVDGYFIYLSEVQPNSERADRATLYVPSR